MKKKKKNKKSGHIHKPQPDNLPTLSVCMIVKNEEDNLPRVLGSIKGLADEVIVVDTGSTDRTVEIARSFGAKVYFFEWCDDFSAARNESLRHATCDYILWLDGDDEVPETEHEKIKRALLFKENNAFYLHIKNSLNNDENVSIQLRIFPNKKGIRFSGKIHEQVYNSIKDAGIEMSLCDAIIIHHGYFNEEEITRKLNRNIEILKKELEEDPANAITIFFLARTYKGLKMMDVSSCYLDRLIEKARKDEKFRRTDIFRIALVEQSSILFMKNKMDEAISLLEEMTIPGETDSLLAFTLGEVYYKSGNHEKAYEYLKCIKNETFNDWLIPVNPKLYRRNLKTYLGISSLFVKDYHTAKNCFAALLEDEPDNKENYHYLALSEEKSGNLDNAIKICTEAMRRFENDESFLKRLFLLLVEKNDVHGAADQLGLIDKACYDLEVLTGGFLINCLTLDLNGINHFYRLLFNALFMADKPFPEDYPSIKERLILLNENRALSLFEKGISHLLNLER